MDDFKRIFSRADIQQICAFLLCGAADSNTDLRSYEQRIKEESKPLYERLEQLYPDEQVREDFFNDICQAFAAYEQVYLELGMKAGARLAFQLLSTQNCM